MRAFDYVIVGAGSAGCVLAAKLSGNGRHTVALLEAAGVDPTRRGETLTIGEFAAIADQAARDPQAARDLQPG